MNIYDSLETLLSYPGASIEMSALDNGSIYILVVYEERILKRKIVGADSHLKNILKRTIEAVLEDKRWS